MKNKKRNGMLVLLLLLVGFIAVGYAALSTTLNITGNSNIGGSTWDVHFENLQVVTDETNVTAKTPAAIQADKKSVKYAVDLNTPGDKYVFTVDVVNKGTIDAKVSELGAVLEGLAGHEKYLNYTVTYENDTKINAGDPLVKTSGKSTLKVTVEFKKNIANGDLPTAAVPLELTFTMNYDQK